jgi:hypothetical protein
VTIRHKLARWFGFTVLISLAPLFAAYLGLKTYSRYHGIISLSEHGELLLIACVIGSSAVGELVPPKTKKRTGAKILVGSITLCLVLISSIYFGLISLGTGTIDPKVVSSHSLILLICTVIMSGFCVSLSEV